MERCKGASVPQSGCGVARLARERVKMDLGEKEGGGGRERERERERENGEGGWMGGWMRE